MSNDLHYKILPSFECEVVEGQLELTPTERSRYTKWLLSNSGKWVLHLEKPRKLRSLAMNRYYWGVVVNLIAEEIGETDHLYVHAILKGIHLSKKVFIKGKEYLAVGRTSKMNTKQFSEYVERVRRWASMELNLVIPDPDRDYYVRELEAEVKSMANVGQVDDEGRVYLKSE